MRPVWRNRRNPRVSISRYKLHLAAKRMLADYDMRHLNTVFAERGPGTLTLEDAYALQRAIAELRMARGERCIGYKIGCVSLSIQEQFGLRRPVWGRLWESEAHHSGCGLSHAYFENLAIEGEIAVRLSRDVPADTACDLASCVECWFPVIELHNYVFRGTVPTSQELIAGNAMHAGFVTPTVPMHGWRAALVGAEIRVEFDGALVESIDLAALPGGPLGSIRSLAVLLAPTQERMKAGDIVLTGSPGRLFSVRGDTVVVVACQEQRVELFIESTGDREHLPIIIGAPVGL